jgi:type II secretory pathway component PulF
MQKKILNDHALSRFYDDLATMQHSGLTIQQALTIIKKGKKDSLFRVIDILGHQVSSGGLFWEAMAQFPQCFDKFQVMSIRAGEESGTLVETCRGLAQYFQMRHKEKRKLLASLLYPVILLHAVVLLPNLKYLVLDNLGKSYWAAVLPTLLTAYVIVGIGILSWLHFLSKGPMRESIDQIILKIPFFGKLARNISLVRVFRSLSGLHNAGIPPAMAATQALETASNHAIRFKLKGALSILEHCGTFTDYFSFSGTLSPTDLGIISVAEESGSFTASLNRMVLKLEDDTSRQLSTAIKAVGYFAYSIAAIIVAVTVISFYSQYFNIV